MVRTVLSDAQWAKMVPHCKGKRGDQGRPGENNRRFVRAVLWIVRTGAPWRDLPAELGNWKSVFKRFRAWVKGDVFKRLFDAVSDEPDMQYAMIDATIVHVHRHAHGAKGGLVARPSASPRVAGRPRSSPSPTHWLTLSGSSSCPAIATTPSVCRR